jgi:hypothetical protein
MFTGYRQFWLPRRGNRREEYEDAFAADPDTGRYAVADGATQSSFAGLWARLLVAEFVDHARFDSDWWRARLPALCDQWYANIPGRPLPYYAEAKLEQGASAALLGVTATPNPEGTSSWQAVAVGDCCLIQTRGPEFVMAFPLDKSASFHSFPKLLGSRPRPAAAVENLLARAEGSGLRGDRLWMMSDALAQWCLAQHEMGCEPWDEMRSIVADPGATEQFAAWIDGLRTARGLRNDDVTLLTVDL